MNIKTFLQVVVILMILAIAAGCNKHTSPTATLYTTPTTPPTAIPTAVTTYTYSGQWGTGPGTGPGQFDRPYDIEIGPDGKIYALDRYNSRVQVFNPDGTFIKQVISAGYGVGQIYYPDSFCIDKSGYIYVVEGPSNRVQKFDSSGNYISVFNVAGPFRMAVDESYNVYIGSYYGNVITKFDAAGNCLTSWGGGGTGNGQLRYPRGMDVYNGKLYVCDSDNNRVQVFSLNGAYDSQWYVYQPLDIAIDAAGYVYVTSFWYATSVYKFTTTGTQLATFGSYGTGDGQFEYPSGIAVDSSQRIYVSDENLHRIQKLGY